MHHLARCAVAADGRVLDGYVAAADDGRMTVAVERGNVITVRAGEDVQVLVLDEARGEVRYSGWVASVGPTTVELADLELTSTLQKRQVVRVRVAQLCTGVVEPVDGDASAIAFLVVDISAHGMRIATTVPLVVGDRVVFDFPTREREVSLDAEVLRTQRTATGATQYGCRFVGLQEKDTDALFRFVLQTQAAQRRNSATP